MGTPPFNINEASPADGAIVSAFPADERSNRDTIESALAVEHDMGVLSANKTGRHAFGRGSTATRDGITTWVVGALWMNTSTTPATLQTVKSIGPIVWEDLTINVATVALLASANVFTNAGGQSSVVGNVDGFTAWYGENAAATTNPGPYVVLQRVRSGVNGDFGPAILLRGRDAAGNQESMVELYTQWINSANGAEASRAYLRTRRAGATSDWYFAQGTLHHETVGQPTNVGEFNAAGVYDNGIRVSTATAGTQADQEAASSNTVFTTPGRAKFHPTAAKAWCVFDGTLTGTNAPLAGFGVTSVTRSSAGRYVVNWSTAFSSASYAVIMSAVQRFGVLIVFVGRDFSTAATTTTFNLVCINSGGAVTDVTFIELVAFGDQ